MKTEVIERGRIADESVELMRRRIGHPNPTIRTGIDTGPWWTEASFDAVRHWVNGPPALPRPV